jgi:hypothetical protein
MKFSDLEQELQNDFPKIELGVDLAQESLKIPALFSKWMQFYNAEKLILNKYRAEAKKLYKRLMEYYSGQASPEVYHEKPLNIKILKGEIDKYIELDSEMIQMKERIENQETKVKFIEETIKAIRDRNFIIKNAIEYSKFISGL